MVNKLKCPNCGNEKDSKLKAEICPICGNVLQMPPLTGGEFEKVDETTIIDKKKSGGKK